MGFRVLLGAVAFGLVLLGSGEASAHGTSESASGVELTLPASETASPAQDNPEHLPLPDSDTASGDDTEPESEEVCTVLMVLRGPPHARHAARSDPKPSALSPPASPPVPPPKPGALHSAFALGSLGADLAVGKMYPETGLGLSQASGTTLPIYFVLGTLSASLSGDSAESDSEEVCTVLLVLRGPPHRRYAARSGPRPLGPQAEAGPPVPPPEPGASTDQTTQRATSGAIMAWSAMLSEAATHLRPPAPSSSPAKLKAKSAAIHVSSKELASILAAPMRVVTTHRRSRMGPSLTRNFTKSGTKEFLEKEPIKWGTL